MTAAELRQVHQLIDDHRITTFLRAAAQVPPTTLSFEPAVSMVEALDLGAPLEEVLLDTAGPEGAPRKGRTVLKAERISARTFRITCGQRGADGGTSTWRVSYRACGKVQGLLREGTRPS